MYMLSEWCPHPRHEYVEGLGRYIDIGPTDREEMQGITHQNNKPG